MTQVEVSQAEENAGVKEIKKRTTATTGSAGEHYVAYRLAQMGLLPALTRGGSPSVDILVASAEGTSSVALQVKTATSAKREHVRKKENDYWYWDVGTKALTHAAPRLFYAFVDLQEGAGTSVEINGRRPEAAVFIVPSLVVRERIETASSQTRQMFWIDEKEKAQYLENWRLITDSLNTHGEGE